MFQKCGKDFGYRAQVHNLLQEAQRLPLPACPGYIVRSGDRKSSTCAVRFLTLVVGWVERQMNGGFRCFNLVLHTSHNMQLSVISLAFSGTQPTLRHDKFH